MNSSIVAAAISGAITLLVSSITIARQSKDREKECEEDQKEREEDRLVRKQEIIENRKDRELFLARAQERAEESQDTKDRLRLLEYKFQDF